jgi:hypothetical protein
MIRYMSIGFRDNIGFDPIIGFGPRAVPAVHVSSRWKTPVTNLRYLDG